jgi:hypothetical protein
LGGACQNKAVKALEAVRKKRAGGGDKERSEEVPLAGVVTRPAISPPILNIDIRKTSTFLKYMFLPFVYVIKRSFL